MLFLMKRLFTSRLPLLSSLLRRDPPPSPSSWAQPIPTPTPMESSDNFSDKCVYMIYTRIHCVYTTLAGSGAAGSADGFGAAVRFYYPCGVAVATATATSS